MRQLTAENTRDTHRREVNNMDICSFTKSAYESSFAYILIRESMRLPKNKQRKVNADGKNHTLKCMCTMHLIDILRHPKRSEKSLESRKTAIDS